MSNLCSTIFPGPLPLPPPVQAFKHISTLPCFQSVPKTFKIHCELLHTLFKPHKLQILPSSSLTSSLALGLPAWPLGLQTQPLRAPCTASPAQGLSGSDLHSSGRPSQILSGQSHLLDTTPASMSSSWWSQAHPRSSVHLQLLQGQRWHAEADTWPRPSSVTICWVGEYRDFPLMFSFVSHFTLLIQLDIILVYGTRWGLIFSQKTTQWCQFPLLNNLPKLTGL